MVKFAQDYSLLMFTLQTLRHFQHKGYYIKYIIFFLIANLIAGIPSDVV